MHNYPMYLLLALFTVLTPGPGVLLTLNNALRHGRRAALGGILGIALGAMLVAALAASGVGMLVAASPSLFSVLKWLGALYLAYLGLRLWRAPPLERRDGVAGRGGFFRCGAEGLSLQLTNPKAIFFFMAALPQFIDATGSYLPQFALLVSTYSALVLLVHAAYALLAKQAAQRLDGGWGGSWPRRLSGAAFLLFGGLLALSGS